LAVVGGTIIDKLGMENEIQDKKDINSIIEAISTIGDEIKKENVTPNGSPAVVKPMNC
jgi:hypothetical protein